MLSSTMDCIIFLYLGMALLDLKDNAYWWFGFIMWTLVFCLVVRFISVYLFTFYANRQRMKPINLQVGQESAEQQTADLISEQKKTS